MTRLFIFILFVGLSQACSQNESENIIRGQALGTTYLVKYYSDSDIQLERALDSIFDVINSSMSTYQSDSDISRINAGDSLVQVDENFREVFEYSQRVYEESGGYFDPSVGVLVNAYGFGPEEQLKKPDSVALDSLRNYVGFSKIRLNNNRIEKEDFNTYLDFNAIAKGFTVDVIARYLERKNVENYLVEVGGELKAKGQNLTKESDWLVAIDDPEQSGGNRSFSTVLALNDRAMATSGNYRKYRIDSITGKRYVHTINPLTGQAEKNDLLSASVLAENCALADAYATAFMALGFQKSLEMLEGLDEIDVYFIYSGEDKALSIYASEGFEQALKE